MRTRRILFDGNFAGDFSLAIVNRLLAAELIRFGADLSIFSDDRAIAADPVFAGHADLVGRRLAEQPARGVFDLHLRNMWPPKTDDMVGARNVYVCFAWEELEFPQYLVDLFNGSLDAVLTTSTFVTDALIHSGVTIPVHTVGLGCDHVPAEPPRRGSTASPARLLHVSSGLARKGVDVLADAFAREFSAHEPVELYVKTTPGPRNVAEDAIAGAANRFPNAAPMLIDERRLDDRAMAALFETATALVGASRGEGFGLPFAEAIRAGVPIVVTEKGGSADFCTPDTAFLVDAALSPSRSHLASLHSVWSEPCPTSLATAMREAIENPALTAEKVMAGQAQLNAHFTWASVANRIALALHTPAPAETSVEIDLVLLGETGDETCAYARRLCDAEPLASSIRRTLTLEAGVEALCEAIAAAEGGALWIHQGRSAPEAATTSALLEATGRGRYRRRALTIGDQVPETPDSRWLTAFDIVFASSAEACSAASRFGARNPVVLPRGAGLRRSADDRHATTTFRVALVEGPGPARQARALIAAAAIARHALPELRLELICASADQAASLQASSRSAGVAEIVSAEPAPRDEDAVIARLAEADLIMIAARLADGDYETALRMALAADRPLLCRPGASLPNAQRHAHAARSDAPIDIAGAIGSLAGRPDARHSLDAARRRVAAWFDLNRIAARHIGHFRERP